MGIRALLGRVVLELATDSKPLKKGLKDAEEDTEKHVDNLGKKAQKVGLQMGKIGAGMTAGITAPFLLFAKGAVDAASDTEESLNKVRVVFGEASGDIEAFAKDSAKNLGLSRQAALDSAGTFGNLFRAIGLGRPEAAKMSKDVLTLAADLGSFNNVKPEEALEKLRAGLVGQSEPLRTMGINLTEAGVKTKALAMGLGEAGRELTEGEKVQARYALIVEQSSLAQGDFANTSTSLANAQKINAAEAANMTAEMGTNLLPIMKEIGVITKNLMGAFMSLSPEIRTGILIFAGLFAVLGPVLVVLGSLVAIAPAIGGAFTLMLGPIGLVILVLAGVVIAVIALKKAWDENLGDVQGKTRAVGTAIERIFQDMKLFVLNVWRGIVTGITAAINGIIYVINGFISAYNGMAQKLGLPLIGKIELITPNLLAVDRAISNVARDRHATIFASVQEQAIAGGGGVAQYATGGTVPGPIGAPQLAVVHGGETVIPAGAQTSPNVAVYVTLDGRDIATAVSTRVVQGARLAGAAL